MILNWRQIGLLLLLCCSFSLPAQAGLLDRLVNSKPQFLPAEQAFPLDAQVHEQQLIARFNTNKDYYLYQHRLYLEQAGEQREAYNYSQAGTDKDDETYGLVHVFYGPLEARFDLSGLQAGTAYLHYQGCAEAGLCYPPQSLAIELQAADVSGLKISSPAIPAASTSNSWFEGKSWWAIAGLFFVLGLGLTFTPCVLPMVPILTSVVLGQGTESGKRGFLLSSTYVIGMALTYAAAGVLMGLLGAGANIQMWLQTPWVLIVFALVFVLLALSMFGLYELQLPSALRDRLNRISSQQQGGRWLGVFIMGMLSALIVSPCISAPLAAALMYISTTGDALLGGLALLALGLGMGVPLIALGTTGASILPKAGGWMEQIKIFFGVVLLAVAIWLLARILPDGISLGLWASLAIIYAVILGAFEAANSLRQRAVKGVAWVVLAYGLLALAGTLMGGTDPLNPLANNRLNLSSTTAASSTPFFRTAAVNELEQQIASAEGLVILDLYADWCISCKIMEKEIFAQPDVQQQLAQARWLQLDVTFNNPEHLAFMQAHGIFGPPTILFFKHGQELTAQRIVGEVSKAEFLQIAPKS